MQSKSEGRNGTRRVHGAEFKAKVLAQCRAEGASVAAVAQANGVNANLVRKWLDGRGLKRCGMTGDAGGPVGEPAQAATALQFVPVDLAAWRSGSSRSVEHEHEHEGGGGAGSGAGPAAGPIQVTLSRGDARVQVQWPASQAGHCAAWLGELSVAVLKCANK